MTRLLQKIDRQLELFRVCVHCGAARVHNPDNRYSLSICCHPCHQRLDRSCNFVRRPDYDHYVLSLYSWHLQNDRLIRDIVNGLKHGGLDNVFDSIAQKLCEIRLNLPPPKGAKYTRVVPAPGKSVILRDHAEQLAVAIANYLGAQYCPVLKRKAKDSQKQKSEKERRAAKSIVMVREGVKVPESPREMRTIFVDDIITTGETAHSAYVALGEPEDFEIWTIFNRIRLRGEPGFAITR